MLHTATITPSHAFGVDEVCWEKEIGVKVIEQARRRRMKIFIRRPLIKERREQEILQPVGAARDYFNKPCWATPILSRVVFFTTYIISSAWRMISWALLA